MDFNALYGMHAKDKTLKMTEQTKTMLSIILDWSTTESMTPKFRLEQKPLMRRLLI